jgi:hypothetical protein
MNVSILYISHRQSSYRQQIYIVIIQLILLKDFFQVTLISPSISIAITKNEFKMGQKLSKKDFYWDLTRNEIYGERKVIVFLLCLFLSINVAKTKTIVEEKEMRIMREKESHPFSSFSFIYFQSLLINTHHADCISRKGK